MNPPEREVGRHRCGFGGGQELGAQASPRARYRSAAARLLLWARSGRLGVQARRLTRRPGRGGGRRERCDALVGHRGGEARRGDRRDDRRDERAADGLAARAAAAADAGGGGGEQRNTAQLNREQYCCFRTVLSGNEEERRGAKERSQFSRGARSAEVRSATIIFTRHEKIKYCTKRHARLLSARLPLLLQ